MFENDERVLCKQEFDFSCLMALHQKNFDEQINGM